MLVEISEELGLYDIDWRENGKNNRQSLHEGQE